MIGSGQIYRLACRVGLMGISCISLCGVMASCNDTDNNPEYREATVSNVVTYVGGDNIGAVFEYVKIDDAFPVRLSTSVTIDDKVQLGQRYMMTYHPVNGDEKTSGFIEPISISAITTLDVSERDISFYPDWNKSGVYLLSAWRSGLYLNIRCKLAYSESPRVLSLAPQLGVSEVGNLYLVHEAPDDVTFDRAYYISFNLSEYLSENPSVKVLKIHVNNTNLDEDVLTFQLQ